ncbi:Neutral zinc metallopeptidase, Zn-binding site [Phytophthora palmivora]|uniref:Neutral zinc metallopeptidase, Zn-binding site n=1 Tax=Phytophthora palmivora TaxID=4796 RepID=A0A2P4XUV7_9STRA|nr:Neutral zinc metallopeptidase, Zn-binding site [Phytophthora palmivora]
MKSRPGSPLFLAALLTATSSAFDFGSKSDVVHTAGTVAPDQATDSLTPPSGVNGFGNFGIPTNPSESTGAGGKDWSSGEFTGTGKQGWSQPAAAGGSWPLSPASGDQGQLGWPSNLGGNQGQVGWPSNPGGDHGWGMLGPDCSESNDGGWTPPGGQEWTPPNGDQSWGTLDPDCSGSNGGGWGTPGSGLIEGGWTPPSGGEGSGTLSVDCSGSGAGEFTPGTSTSLGGSTAVEGSQETPGSSMESPTTDAPSTAETSLTSSSTGDQGASQPSSTGTEASLPSGNTEDQGSSLLSPAESSNTGDQTSQTEIATTDETEAGSTVGADADQTSMRRSSTTTSESETSEVQQQAVAPGGKTAGGDTVKYISTWGAPVVAETGTNLVSAKPTFGKITSKSGGCVVGAPTEYISSKYLDWVWQNRIGPEADTSKKANWNVMANKNWIMDHIVHNKGSMNYCVRWDTDNTLSKEVASKFQGVLERHYNAWNEWLDGYNCWPFKQIKINMVGWATKDASQFEWTDDSMGTIYEGTLDPTDGVPQCPTECYRFYDNVSNQWSDTSACKGEPFDVSFWLKEDIPYGFGYDWGQEVSLNDTMKNLDDKNIMFIGHEIGHGFGLPDFYGMDEKPDQNFPNSIMMAFSSSTITPSDGWMLRRILDHVRDRYNF